MSIKAQELFSRYEQLKAVEDTKDALIEDLLARVNELEEAYQREKLDHDRETRFNREVQMHEIELMEQLTRMRAIMDQEPFFIALLDGDGMIFQDALIRNGEQGGKDAANQLWLSLRDYATRNFPNVQSPKIITRIYANVRGLADVCVKTGIIDHPSIFEDFARGFNGSGLLFDFVDVGSGNSRTDDKIAEILKLNLFNCHCHQIFLGCSHDNGYARLLEDNMADRELARRITLLEGVPFEKELASLTTSYNVTKFDNLFRDSKIAPVYSQTWQSQNSDPASSIINPPGTSNLHTVTRTSSSNGQISTSATSSTYDSNTQGTWAATIAANSSAPFKDLTISSKPSTPSPPTIERNKHGQRVDRIDFKAAPKEELSRVKKLKLCNLFFLVGDCPNPKCYHTHDYKLTKQEHTVLQVVARMTPCHFGTECDDPTCIYGHRCPLSENGRKDCYWGSNCRFDTDAHGIDTNVVKLTKV
ncbi:hypothetical protein FQN57_006245 [Myotisia sp. PD_48]|nr:hypothetical protein FQN57_006245 [Myotisia sp. PD_48]